MTAELCPGSGYEIAPPRGGPPHYAQCAVCHQYVQAWATAEETKMEGRVVLRANNHSGRDREER